MSLLRCVYVGMYLSLSLRFNGHFPGEPGLVGVYWSKWWRWWWQLDYWSYKSCKAPVKSSPPTNQHPVFLQAVCPSFHKACMGWSWAAAYRGGHIVAAARLQLVMNDLLLTVYSGCQSDWSSGRCATVPTNHSTSDGSQVHDSTLSFVMPPPPRGGLV